MLNKTSMIIPIKDNHHMLDEIIRYHAPTGIHIYIVHDTTTPYADDIRITYDNVHYACMPNTSVGERVRYALETVTTPYCVFRGDRRHISNTSIHTSVRFLEDNQDYSSSSGIWLQNDLSLYYMIELLGKNGLHNDPLERVQTQALSYQLPYYNVQRTLLSKVYFEILKRIEKNIQNLYYYEYIHAFLCFFTGKTKQFTHFTGIVQDKAQPSSYREQWRTVLPIFQSVEHTEYMIEIIKSLLPEYGFSVQHIAEALRLFHANMAIRFIGYRINTVLKQEETVKSFSYMEELFAQMNQNTAQGNVLSEKYLRTLLTLSFSEYAHYKHIKHLFEKSDFSEMNAVMRMMENIKKNAPR